MPKSEESLLRGRVAQPESGSVLDFLYQDVRRIGSFLAQINPSGHIQTVKQTLATEESGSTDTTASAVGNAVVAKGTLGYTTHEGDVNRDTLERTIDPLWQNAIDLLNLLTDRGLLNRDLDKAGLGSFVLVSGRLLLFDTANAKAAQVSSELRSTNLQAVADQILTKGTFLKLFGDADPKSLQENQKRARAKRDTKILMDLLGTLPQSVHAKLKTKSGQLIYSSIQPSGLTMAAVDIAINHGPVIQGEWIIFGIFDARPDSSQIDVQKVSDDFRLNDSQVLKSAVGYTPMMRQIGRSDSLYGVTPLLIFRELST